MIQLRRHNIRWEVAPGCRQLLDKIIADPGHAIKQTHAKLVTRHQINGRTYYVKRYINAGVGLRPLKFFFKQSDARKEWAIAQRYGALGIPLVTHIAVGECWTLTGLQESLIVTEGFDGLSLSRSGRDQRLDVQAAVGQMLRHMHDVGVLQPDLHHNILVRIDPVELRRVDVDRGELKAALTDAERVDNLAWLDVSVPLSDAFFAAYGASPEFIHQVKQRSAVMRCESRAQYSWRSVGNNLRFAPMKFGGHTWHVRKEFLSDQLRRVLEHPDQPTEPFDVRRFATAGRFRSVALRAYRTAYHLELLGIPTPRPIAGARHYCVTERVAGKLCPPDAVLMEKLQREGFTFDGEVGDDVCLATDDGRVLVARVDRLKFQMPTQSR